MLVTRILQVNSMKIWVSKIYLKKIFSMTMLRTSLCIRAVLSEPSVLAKNKLWKLTKCHAKNIWQSLDSCAYMLDLFVCDDALHPSLQFFSHVGTWVEPVLSRGQSILL